MGSQATRQSLVSPKPISSPESAFLLVSTKNTDSGYHQRRKSANHGLPARLRTLRNLKQQRLPTVTKPLRIYWKWLECVFLVLTKRKEDSGDKIVPKLWALEKQANAKLNFSGLPFKLIKFLPWPLPTNKRAPLIQRHVQKASQFLQQKQ